MFIFVKKITMTLKEKLEVEIMDLPIMSEVIDDIGKDPALQPGLGKVVL